MSSIFHGRIGKGGRLVIPAEARQQLHLDEGDEVVMEVQRLETVCDWPESSRR